MPKNYFILSSIAAFLLAIGSGNASEPLVLIQSSSLNRMIQVSSAIGIQDPIASTGLGTQSTLELMKSAIRLDQPCGAMVYIAEDHPVLVVCLPLLDRDAFLNSISTLAGKSYTHGADDVYQIGDEQKSFFVALKDHVLLSDSRHHLGLAALSFETKQWESRSDDIRLIVNLRKLHPIQKQMVLGEVLSLTSTRLTSDLQLNFDSLRQQFAVAMQRYLMESLFAANYFESNLNVQANGDVVLSVETQELVQDANIRSQFGWKRTEDEILTIDFASLLGKGTKKSVVEWAERMEKDLIQTLEDQPIQKRSDEAIIVEGIRFLSESVKQTVAEDRIDVLVSAGTHDEEAYAIGAVAVANGSGLADRFNQILAKGSELGLRFEDLRSDKSSHTADVLIDLPIPIPFFGNNDGRPIPLHIVIGERKFVTSVGRTARQLLDLSENHWAGASQQETPVQLTVDIDALKSFGTSGELANPLPFQATKMSLAIETTQEGRRYQAHFSKPETHSPAPRSLQVSTSNHK